MLSCSITTRSLLTTHKKLSLHGNAFRFFLIFGDNVGLMSDNNDVMVTTSFLGFTGFWDLLMQCNFLLLDVKFLNL